MTDLEGISLILAMLFATAALWAMPRWRVVWAFVSASVGLTVLAVASLIWRSLA